MPRQHIRNDTQDSDSSILGEAGYSEAELEAAGLSMEGRAADHGHDDDDDDDDDDECSSRESFSEV
jgi:hypothetical protein